MAIIRELKKEDLWNGFIKSLDTLSHASDIDRARAEEVFEEIDANRNHVIIVAEVDGRIVGSGTLIIEQKFIHKGGLVGHIEDWVIDKEFQGRGIGRKITERMLEIARERGCYKTILDCKPNLESYYKNMGFRENEMAMRLDHA